MHKERLPMSMCRLPCRPLHHKSTMPAVQTLTPSWLQPHMSMENQRHRSLVLHASETAAGRTQHACEPMLANTSCGKSVHSTSTSNLQEANPNLTHPNSSLIVSPSHTSFGSGSFAMKEAWLWTSLCVHQESRGYEATSDASLLWRPQEGRGYIATFDMLALGTPKR